MNHERNGTQGKNSKGRFIHHEPGKILLAHDGGGLLSHELVIRLFLPVFRNDYLECLGEQVLAVSPHIHCLRDATRGGLGAILAEIAGQSSLEITLDETLLPVRDHVRGVCEILGFDPLFLANEDRMTLFCPEPEAGKVLTAMHRHAEGAAAVVVGRVAQAKRGRLILKTIIGGSREMDLPTGELVPRIC